MIVRAMTAADWPEVTLIYTQSLEKGTASFAKDCPAWEIWDAGHRPDCRLVCEDSGKVVGFAALSPTSSKPHYSGVAEVSVYVDEARLHCGIGTALLNRLIEEADAAGIWTLYSSIFAENAASIALHKKCGFRLIGTRDRIAKNIFGRWQSTVIMERRNGIE